MAAVDESQGLDQRSAAWLFARVGHVTASRFKDVLAKLKSGAPAKAREDYLWQIVVEKLTGAPTDSNFVSSAMQYGIDNEHGGEAAYAARTGRMVEAAGFIHHPSIEGVGGSPDGLIGDDGGIEIKCPFNSAVHLQTFLEGMPMEHMPQVQGIMWITGRQWWDFTSYDPRLPAPFDIYIERIQRDEDFIGKMALEIEVFQKDVATMLARLNMMGGGA